MFKYVLAITGLLFFAGCQRSETRVISEDDFPAPSKLSAEEMTFDVNSYDKFYIVDSIMLAYHAFSDNVFIDAYRLPSLDYLGMIARKGRGPNEFLDVGYLDNNYYYDNGDLNILVYDQVEMSAHVINVSQTIEEQRTVVERDIKFSKRVIRMWLMDKNHLLLQGDFYEGFDLCYFHNLESGEYTDIGHVFEKFDLSNTYATSCMFALFPNDRHKALMHYRRMNSTTVQEISESGGNILEGPYSIFSESLEPRQLPYSETAKVIYNDICIVGDDVYCLYMNQTTDETFSVPQPVEVHQFDKNLNPVKRYLIDEHIRFIAVDGINKSIYGVTADDKYYKYDI
jgi:hypothetical protein